MKLNFKILLTVLIFLIIFSCKKTTLPIVKIKINEKIYSFEVANSYETRKTGLMNRKKLDKNGGMLFVYGVERYMSFWMKNTLIPLDIAFIDSNRIIIDIRKMYPLDETEVKSSGKALMALETNQGFFELHQLKVGDRLEFATPIPFGKD